MNRRHLLPILLAAAALGCESPSDEEILRRTFAVPRAARLVSLDVSPKTPGWFGREGLTIDAVFGFGPDELAAYRVRLGNDPTWRPLPPEKEFLLRMIGAARQVEGIRRTYENSGRPLPTPGSVYFPTVEQVWERWSKRLPLDAASGVWACRTAGDDLMRARKSDCSERPGDLNDFMFAVLDTDRRTLRVAVHTTY